MVYLHIDKLNLIWHDILLCIPMVRLDTQVKYKTLQTKKIH